MDATEVNLETRMDASVDATETRIRARIACIAPFLASAVPWIHAASDRLD